VTAHLRLTGWRVSFRWNRIANKEGVSPSRSCPVWCDRQLPRLSRPYYPHPCRNERSWLAWSTRASSNS